jgi:hypothetical protein
VAVVRVDLTKGYRVDCTHAKCGPIGFETTRAKAEEMRTQHLDLHTRYEKAVEDKLGGLVEDDKAKPDVQLRCPGCNVPIGVSHVLTCDVARCLMNGGQRVLKDHKTLNGKVEENHYCGQDIWTGFYPGEKEATEYGVPLMVLKELGRWDQEKIRWVLDDGWEERMRQRGLGPAISGV